MSEKVIVDEKTPLTVTDRLREYTPPAAIPRSSIFAAGLAIFVLSSIWPPLILVATYLLSVGLSQWIRVTDDATERRKILHEFDLNQPAYLAKYRAIPSDITLKEGYWTNARGMCLFYNILKPTDAKKIKAVICYCHGYADSPVYTKRPELLRFVKQGIAVVMLEIEGHGRSDGSSCLIKDRNKVIDDTSSFYSKTVREEFPPNIKCFLMGESLGGAVAYCTYNRIPDVFSGVVFLAPMCKIADELMPPKFVVDFCRLIGGPTGTCTSIGYLPIAPAKGKLEDLTFHLPEKRVYCTAYPNHFARNARLATARELLDLTVDISNSINKFDAPFLVLHGKEDKVTDPKLSKYLHDNAASKDKSIKLYEGCWHALLVGEEDEDIDKVFHDATEWILKRA